MTAMTGFGTARLAGFLLGAALAVTLVVASRPAAGGEAVGASISIAAVQTGEFAVDPAEPEDFLRASELRPGATARGAFRMRNQTGRREAVRLRLAPSSHELDSLLTIRISSGQRTLASGPLGSMADGAGEPIVLPPGQPAGVDVSVSLAEDAGNEVAASLVEIAVTFEGVADTNTEIPR